MLALKATLASVVLGLTGWLGLAGQIGWMSATLAVHQGKYQFLTYGLPVSWIDEYSDLMLQRYGVTHRRIAGCQFSDWQREYANAFNDVTNQAIMRKYGRDVAAQTGEEVRKRWFKRSPWSTADATSKVH